MDTAVAAADEEWNADDARGLWRQADSGVTDPQVAADLKKKRTFRTFSYRRIELDKLLDLSNEEVC